MNLGKYYLALTKKNVFTNAKLITNKTTITNV